MKFDLEGSAVGIWRTEIENLSQLLGCATIISTTLYYSLLRSIYYTSIIRGSSIFIFISISRENALRAKSMLTMEYQRN